MARTRRGPQTQGKCLRRRSDQTYGRANPTIGQSNRPSVRVADRPSELSRNSSERGLSPATLNNYRPIVRRFLTERFGSTPMRLDELRTIDIHRFIVRRVQTGSRRSAQLMVTALRAFLRFLQQRGSIAADLADAVPGVANWCLSHLPKSLPPEQVERMLACCNRGTPVGQRDYVILLFLARLGLRAGE
ncbi:MAG: site-specific integrase, partial [Rhodopila sp.]